MEDRRSWLRFTVQLDVRLRILDGSFDDIEGTVVDVSFMGVGISTTLALQPGTEILVEWPDPPFYFSGEAIAKGRVVNISNEHDTSGHFRLNVHFADSATELAQSLVNWAQTKSGALHKISYY